MVRKIAESFSSDSKYKETNLQLARENGELRLRVQAASIEFADCQAALQAKNVEIERLKVLAAQVPELLRCKRKLDAIFNILHDTCRLTRHEALLEPQEGEEAPKAIAHYSHRQPKPTADIDGCSRRSLVAACSQIVTTLSEDEDEEEDGERRNDESTQKLSLPAPRASTSQASNSTKSADENALEAIDEDDELLADSGDEDHDDNGSKRDDRSGCDCCESSKSDACALKANTPSTKTSHHPNGPEQLDNQNKTDGASQDSLDPGDVTSVPPLRPEFVLHTPSIWRCLDDTPKKASPLCISNQFETPPGGGEGCGANNRSALNEMFQSTPVQKKKAAVGSNKCSLKRKLSAIDAPNLKDAGQENAKSVAVANNGGSRRYNLRNRKPKKL